MLCEPVTTHTSSCSQSVCTLAFLDKLPILTVDIVSNSVESIHSPEFIALIALKLDVCGLLGSS